MTIIYLNFYEALKFEYVLVSTFILSFDRNESFDSLSELLKLQETYKNDEFFLLDSLLIDLIMVMYATF